MKNCFAVDHSSVSMCMNLLIWAVFEMAEKRMDKPFPDRDFECPEHVYAFSLVMQEKK